MVKTRSKARKINRKENTSGVLWKPGSYVWACMNKIYWPGK